MRCEPKPHCSALIRCDHTFAKQSTGFDHNRKSRKQGTGKTKRQMDKQNKQRPDRQKEQTGRNNPTDEQSKVVNGHNREQDTRTRQNKQTDKQTGKRNWI